ncbi:MAG TPA: AraC family transcriptional regulator [Chitinophagaceae bacterium]|nr:AraC family transcriptional regulator [Chitinophagaceae bacterium]
MTYYHHEITRIRHACYANQEQLNTVIRIRRYMDHHFERELNLDLLSRVAFTSKFHLLRLFKKYYGLTPLQYLTEKRLEKSRDCLKAGMLVSDACFSAGFTSPSSFSTLFKQKMGLSPAAFQKRAISAK